MVAARKRFLRELHWLFDHFFDVWDSAVGRITIHLNFPYLPKMVLSCMPIDPLFSLDPNLDQVILWGVRRAVVCLLIFLRAVRLLFGRLVFTSLNSFEIRPLAYEFSVIVGVFLGLNVWLKVD